MVTIIGKNKYVDLKGLYNPLNGHVIIFTNSKYRQTTTKSLLPHILRLRNSVLKKTGSSSGTLLKKYEFKSAGSAASVLCGSMINGLDFFVLKDGRTINEAFFGKNHRNSKIKALPRDDSETPLLLSNDKKYKRIYSIGKNALKKSGYSCFVDANHETFITDEGVPYMEAHHLIPFKYQKDFEFSLQVQANLVCLCPLCHRKLHYAKNKEAILKTLFEDRKDLLKKCNIYIDFPKLLEYYDLKRKK